ncbi:hypothetical protein GCM10009721_38370 [Terrabacter tumescens]|uniref:DUF5063 domain-containing protein n=1 Tax=Terrabacter tumescens TaxID=60443 RepID=A0ABQ2IHR5_9MICO|nr:DUF5063 domain-containing protein [Terrabacter tumescens]GGN07013.1 hypothetical protein GCM10009721_38370 [Terrabacter tumescens]
MPSPSEPVEAFIEVARSYCELIEHVETLPRATVLDDLAVLLPRLLELVVRLPAVEPSDDVEADEVSYGEWRKRYVALNEILAGVGDYWTAAEVRGDQQPEVVNLPLADDLADIWHDLRAGLSLVGGPPTVDNAVWEWRFHFEIHWGRHAVEALRAVHAARSDSPRT